jgi:pseudaminic acid synthase
MRNEFKIGNRFIGENHSPFIIAEMSGNHNQSLERALEIVEAAAKSGVHALKLQTYTADTITLNVRSQDFEISDKSSLWSGQNLYDLYKQAYTPWEWHAPIMKKAKELGMVCFSSPFDETAVEFLEELDVPAYKIASFENIHIPLIEKAASTGKPLIISTGMASIAELDDAVTAARKGGCKDLVLLKCTSTYPALPINSNLITVPHMRELFECQVGLSDHTMGTGVSVAAVALGATVVEKHFTLRRADGGVDSVFSLEPEEMKSLVIETERAWQSLGSIKYGATEAESKSLVFRRSLYVSADVTRGTVLSSDNVRCVRPGFGLPPKFYDQVIGLKVNRDISKGTPLSWNLILDKSE